MGELTKIRLRTLVWLILPVTILVLIPCLIQRASRHACVWHGGPWQWLGAWLIVNGVGLAVWCVNLFNVQGQGTPLPFNPPKRFVVSGPYRHVRNPMMLGALLILGGEDLACESVVLWLYLLVIMTLAHLVVRFWEEPELIRRFGEPYREYQRQVPRWIPRLPGTRKKT